LAYVVSNILTDLDNYGFSGYDSTTKLRVINRVYKRVCRLENWPFMDKIFTSVNTVAGTATLPTVTGLNKIISCINTTTGWHLRPMRDEEIRKNFPDDLTEQGEPVWYYLVGNTVYLYPVPDTVYALDLHGNQTVTELAANDSVTILIPDDHREVLLFGAAAMLARFDDDHEGAQAHYADFKDRLNDMRADVWATQLEEFDYIEDVMEDFDGYN
jgi:hypothetical protein